MLQATLPAQTGLNRTDREEKIPNKKVKQKDAKMITKFETRKSLPIRTEPSDRTSVKSGMFTPEFGGRELQDPPTQVSKETAADKEPSLLDS